MPRFVNNVNLTGQQLQNAVVHPVATDVATPNVGQIWFNTVAGSDSQGRLKIKLSTRTMILDDQYVSSVGTGTALTNSGTGLAPILNVQAASGAVPGTLSAADYTLLHTATSLATASALVQRDASGNAVFNQLTINNAPVNPSDAVNLAFAQSMAAGFDPKAAVTIATVGALPANVYANGASGVGATLTASVNSTLSTTLLDGSSTHVLAVNDPVLVKNEATGANNGIYLVTSLGSGASKWILTRATNFNSATVGPALISNGAFVPVGEGANAGTMWMVTGIADPGVVVGTSAIAFSQFGSSQVYTNGSGITLTGNVFSVNLTGTSSLETVAGALRVKSSVNAGAPLLSGGTGAEAVYGPLNLAGGATVISGLLPKVNGGFGQDVSQGIAANLFAASPNGASGAMTFRAMVATDLPSGVVTPGTYPKVTVDTYGRVTAGATLLAADIPALPFTNITGIVPLAQGGTGLNLSAFWNAPTVDKVPVMAVGVANLNIASPGATIDGVAMSAGQRVLLTAQTTGSQNGLWVWNGSASALTRPLDFPSGSTTHAFYGVSVTVLSGGTAMGGTEWNLSTTGAMTIDTTSSSWTMVPYNITSGSTYGVLSTANGGTGSATAAGARTNLAVPVQNSGLIGDGSTLALTFTHSLALANPSAYGVSVVVDATGETIYPDVINTANSATITYGAGNAPAVNAHRVTIFAKG